jgi:hypothetical protein
MISRRLWPIFTFFTPFLSCKGVGFSPVTGIYPEKFSGKGGSQSNEPEDIFNRE